MATIEGVPDRHGSCFFSAAELWHENTRRFERFPSLVSRELEVQDPYGYDSRKLAQLGARETDMPGGFETFRSPKRAF